MAQHSPRRAVYSALVGGYENPRDTPTPHEAGVDYLLFTDSDDVRAPLGWRLVKTSPRFATDPVRSARYLKIVGHPILDDYDETLWIDNRVVLRTPAASLFAFISEYDIALPRHSLRSDLTSEFSEVIAAGYDDPQRVREMFDIAVSHGVEHQQPLWTGLLLRKRTADVAECMQRWLELLLLTSRRDQLSINVALAASSLRVNTLGFEIVSSEYHYWMSNTVMNRDSSIQMWRSKRRPFKLGVGDAMRSFPFGRKGARALTRMGLTIPTLDD
ncbi:MAG: hypothetical protein JWR34_4802 [Mycobacterium sp.]|nr:hypothetical protein [Mycobacterium sp.]